MNMETVIFPGIIGLDALCRCCLVHPPDNYFKRPYTMLDKTEVYAEMLKECFEINILSDSEEDCQGICLYCIKRLRDAFDFKQQVIRCQKDLQMKLPFSDELVKHEFTEHNDDYHMSFYEVKEELPDLDIANEHGIVVDELNLKKVKVKHKSERKKKRLEKRNGRESKKGTDMLRKKMSSLNKVDNFPDDTISENVKNKSNIEKILKYSNCTPFFNKSIAGISCVSCKECHKSMELLSVHFNEKHQRALDDDKRYDRDTLSIKMDITDLKCNICNLKVKVIAELKQHLTAAHGIQFYDDVNDYFLEFKLTDCELFDCALCHSTFETFKMLLQHMNVHYRNYICDECDMGFINNHRLKNHKRTHELGTFKCAFCEKIFSTKLRQMCHEKYTHNRNARYTTNCPHCEKSFTSYYQRNRHMKAVHNVDAASYKCNICDKSFIMKSKLTTHIKKVHLMERNHICKECGQGFFVKQSLDEHMVKHNGEKVFKCTVCGKAYARKKTLTEHMRIHNNDRRFRCGVCGLTFVQKCSLKSHMMPNHGFTLSEFEEAMKKDATSNSGNGKRL